MVSLLEYGIFYKSELYRNGVWKDLPPLDVFISAYNPSDRVCEVFKAINAARKIWIIHKEYGIEPKNFPEGEVIAPSHENEAEFIREVVDALLADKIIIPGTTKLGIDITGVMRPHLMFLVRYLELKGVTSFQAIYSEPARYKKKEKTAFSDGAVSVVRQVAGYEGSNNTDTANDLLIIGAGYDYPLIADVAEEKDRAEKVQIYGLPSLQADMYQQNVLQTRLAADALGGGWLQEGTAFFAPAHDPFATAGVLREIVQRREKRAKITNLYLSPLATKAQALGFSLYFIGECLNRNASIIFPFCAKYSSETSEGISKVWCYSVQFPIFQ